MLSLVLGLFGLIIGSFLNVVILRHGAKSLGGRSSCFSCGTEIAWHDNIPVISYVLLRGRCRSCRSSISIQYPLVELLTAAVFAFIGAATSQELPSATGAFLLVDYCAIAAVLVAILVYDLKHTIIPDLWVSLFAIAALLTYPLNIVHLVPLVPYLLGGPTAALPLFALWLISGGRWMGLGDSKLALGMGWLLGPVYGIVAVFLAFMIGAIVSLAILLPLPWYRAQLQRWGLIKGIVGASFTMKSEVPFGPFLIASTLILWLMLLTHVPLPL